VNTYIAFSRDFFFTLQPRKFTSKVHCEKFFISGSARVFFLKCDTYRYEFRQTGFNSDNRRVRCPYKPRTSSCNNLNFPLTLLLLGTLIHAYMLQANYKIQAMWVCITHRRSTEFLSVLRQTKNLWIFYFALQKKSNYLGNVFIL